MIQYYRIGGQLMARVKRPAPYRFSSIWYVTWGDRIMPLLMDHPTYRVPDDIQ
jgi:hypothetical protein